MSEYQNVVGIVKFQDGTYDCYPDAVGVPPSVDYIKLDIAEQLAQALQSARSAINLREPEDMDALDDVALKKIDSALEAYRKAKGE